MACVCVRKTLRRRSLSRASPLPQGLELATDVCSTQIHCGSGLAPGGVPTKLLILEVGEFLPDLRLEEQRLALRQPDQAVVIFHHFRFDQFALAFDLQRHPCRRAQRTNIPHLGRVVILQLLSLIHI